MTNHPAISLTKIGNTCVVSIEINNEWVPVIVDGGDTISHIVEPGGIESAISRKRRGRIVADWETPQN